MAKKQAGENSKKAAGNAKKAEAAATKAASENMKKAQAEAEEWSKGAKSNSKAEAAAAKKAEADRKKAEKDALLKAEEANAPSGPKNSKKAEKKPAVKRGLDLSQLDDSPTGASPSALNASGIDNALDALALTSSTKEKIDRHPERRFKAAYAEFEERRLLEMEQDGSGAGLRKNQRQERIRKEFEKSPLNPYNQVTGRYDSTKSELEEIRQSVKAGVEARLGGN
ncbi:hypothetical protein DSL72_003739 [Monilinia vaccinii-corymbosi]|uniref:DUF1014 domain-containing protein n=1 Tax=Monilinia vaccinii-corymbosi TaxID=61207 RepID=A0A8A3P9A8_9HELO|nr:hypothetical protein DSL72_003739 [Monilinia vaccinii-corymbosi]